MNKSIFYYSIAVVYICIISIPLILPYFHKGYFPTHDGEWAVVRLADMFRELKDHQFPARFSGNLNFGYGYPLFNFAYPLPYYIGIIFHFLKINFVDTIKLLFAVSVPLSGIAMFLTSRLLWKKTAAGIISATLFLYLPYRLVDLYARGSLGESLAFVFFPAIFFCVLKIIETGKTSWIGLCAVFYGCLILTHNIMAVYFTIIIVPFLIGKVFTKDIENLGKVLISIIFGFLISSFFWLPALLEKNLILLSKIPIADRSLYYVSLKQLFIPTWGYGVPTAKDSFTYQLGIPQIIALVNSILLLIYNFYKKKNISSGFIILTIIFILSIFLFNFSATLWRLPLLSEINYPWTLIGPIGFLICLLSGILASKKYALWIGLLACLIAFVLITPYAKPEAYVDRGEGFYITNDATTTSSHEYMPLWVKTIPFQRPYKKIEILSGKGSINNIFYNSKEINFLADLSEKSHVRINTIYYPGWKSNSSFTYNNSGVMEFWLDKGMKNVSFKFEETPMRLASDFISLISLIFIICLFFKSYFFKKIKFNK